MKTTRAARRAQYPEAEYNRDRAWGRLLESPGGVRRHSQPGSSESAPTLLEVARAYDRICQRARGIIQPDVEETDILATLLVIRMLRDKLESDELQLISLARTKRITWERIADALELSGRQSAERRHLQLTRAHRRADGTLPRTQSERVESVREHRSRRAERDWALRHGELIRDLAVRLASVEGLQARVDRSHEARILTALEDSREGGPQEHRTAMRLVWPQALSDWLIEDERFRTTPQESEESAADPAWERQQQEADILHQLLGLISYATNPRNIDLSDLPDLFQEIVRVHGEYQQQTRIRR
ncbi:MULTISPECIES: hypothetical protein [unclassified Streptomyces]|uniref:Uncharacterized protein n=1 Tax=Streptomyces sp. NBC_00060 TaxID=2975636 RepID=A0AAU2GXZ0_9ACTN